MNYNKLLVVTGPTAVGKSEISIKLATKLNGEILSADSMQIYRTMDIGSAKISHSEMQGITHHLLDIVDPKVSFSVAEYKTSAEAIIKDIISKGNLPIITGGTGLYIDSIISNLTFTEAEKDEKYREFLLEKAESNGREYVHSLLKEIDYASFLKLHPNNLKRVIRALEVYKLTGRPFSSFEEMHKYNTPYDLYYYVITMDREKLYTKINNRVDIMMEKGLLQEVKRLREEGCNSDMQSMKGIGYKELLYYLDDKISLEAAINLIKQGSRNYAKRQLTWFRKDPRVKWIVRENYKNDEEIVDFIANEIKSKN